MRDRGFTLVEMVMVVAIALVLGVIAVSTFSNIINGVKLEYAATNLAGLLQKCRMEAVRSNSYYQVWSYTNSNNVFYFVDLKRDQRYSDSNPTDPVVNLGRFTVYTGTGAGAPQESSFESSSNFSGFTWYSDSARFNARGLPCSMISGVCKENPGSAYIYYLQGPNNKWASVVVTPSGRVQVWTYDGGGNWVQR